jgi:hypothetical protein
MLPRRTLLASAVFFTLTATSLQAHAQARQTLRGGGATFTYSRPGDRRLWGIGARLQGYPRSALIYRLRASSQFYRTGSPDPLLFTAGVDLGVTPPRGPQLPEFSPTLTLGAGLFYYVTGRDIDSNCTSAGCSPFNRGYDPGPLVVWTATLGFDAALTVPWSMFAEFALHVPSGIGRNGFAGDPHAAFPGFAFGLMRRR